MPLAEKTVRHYKLFGAQTIKHFLYTKEEADALGISYVPWREVDADELPAWVEDDAGVVGMFFERRWIGYKKLWYFYSTWGNFCCNIGRKKIKIYFRPEDKPIREGSEMPIGKARVPMKQYIVMLMARGVSKKEALRYLGIGNQYGMMQGWFNTQEFKVMFTKEVENILEKAGFDREKIIAMYGDIFQAAKKKGDVKTMMEITDRLAALNKLPIKYSLTAKKVEVSETDAELPKALEGDMEMIEKHIGKVKTSESTSTKVTS